MNVEKGIAIRIYEGARRTIRFGYLLMFFAFSSFHSFGQYSVTVCQSDPDAMIGPDRNDWSHANLAVVNEGYLHNFSPVDLPCGLETASLTSVEISIDLESNSGIANCNNIPVFGNVLLNCPLTTSSICPIVQDVLSPGCAFGAGQSAMGTYTLNINGCGVAPMLSDVIGVDIIPATELLGTCPITDSAISDGEVDLEYEICITYTFDQDLPANCTNTMTLACDDGDPCTVNDMTTVDACDSDLICIPCAGVLDATCDDTIALPCDDGDPCTVDDIQIVSACDDTFVCLPCSGEPESDCSSTVDLPCDDGDDCTENDVEVVSACDNGVICLPCQGTAVAQCVETISMPCDDGDDCTENDTETVDACDMSIICIPCAGELISNCDETVVLPCDDGDPCTVNDSQTVSACDNAFICEPCMGELLIDCSNTVNLPCDDGDPCTSSDIVTVSACDEDLICAPCAGTIVESCTNTIAIPCDDGDVCTQNDVEIVDACFPSMICVPCQGSVIPPQQCDDGDCDNGVEIWDELSCTCITVPAIIGCMDQSSCNYDPLANCDDGCDFGCVDCLGIPFGAATIDNCGLCLLPEDPLRDLSCLDPVYVPNAFTPDGDGLNDYFSIRSSLDLAFFEIRIFDRFGQEIFYSDDVEFKWTGNIDGGEYYGSSQLFIYRIEYSSQLPDLVQKIGTVALLR